MPNIRLKGRVKLQVSQKAYNDRSYLKSLKDHIKEREREPLLPTRPIQNSGRKMKLKKARMKAGLSRIGLARIAQMSDKTIYQIETDDSYVPKSKSVKKLEKIFTPLGVKLYFPERKGKCKLCGKPFFTRVTHQEYCDELCRNRHWRGTNPEKSRAASRKYYKAKSKEKYRKAK